VILRALFRLLSLAAVAVAGWWIARLLRGSRGGPGPRRTAVRTSDGAMVRDHVCNTFLPRDRALEACVGDETHFFCSEACRRRFLQEARAAEPA
jgi:YHS domain-containing protein